MNNNYIAKEKFSCKYWALCLLLSSPFSMYTLGVSTVTLTEWLLLFGIVLFLIERKSKIVLNYDVYYYLKAMTALFFISTISHIIQTDIQNIVIIRNFRLLMYVTFIIISYNMITENILIKYLYYVTLIAVIYVLAQYLSYHIAGIYLTNQLLPLPVNREISEDILLLFDKYYFRAYGFFAEPSYFAKFLIPGFSYCLYGWGKNRIDYFGSLLMIAAVFCSTSLQGIVLIFFMLSFRVIDLLKTQKISLNKILRIVLMLLLLVSIYFLFSKQNEIDYIILRIENLFSLNIGISSSSSYRLFRGFYVFEQLPWLFQILGIGFGGLAEYIIANNIFTPYDASFYISTNAAGYVNGISSILINFGVIGFVVLVYIFYKIYRISTTENRLILFAYLICLFSGGGIFDLFMVYIFSIIFIGNRIKHKSKFL